MSPELVLGPAILSAVRQVVREEMGAAARRAPERSPEPPPELLSPREASERLQRRVSEETIRAWIHCGRLPKRTNNATQNPKRPNFLVRLAEVIAAIEAPDSPTVPSTDDAPVDLEKARARACELASKRWPGKG